MTLYEQIYKIVKEKKVKRWNFCGNTYEFTHFSGNNHYYVRLCYVGKYHDEYLTTTHNVKISTHNTEYIIRKLMYQIIRNSVVDSKQVKFNVYYAKQKLVQVHGLNGDFYGWKKV